MCDPGISIAKILLSCPFLKHLDYGGYGDFGDFVGNVTAHPSLRTLVIVHNELEDVHIPKIENLRGTLVRVESNPTWISSRALVHFVESMPKLWYFKDPHNYLDNIGEDVVELYAQHPTWLSIQQSLKLRRTKSA